MRKPGKEFQTIQMKKQGEKTLKRGTRPFYDFFTTWTQKT